MEFQLSQYFWAIRMGAVGLAVAFCTSAVVNRVATDKLLDASDAPVSVDSGDEDPRAPSDLASAYASRTSPVVGKTKTGESIVAHNLFCPTCKPIEAIADPTQPLRPGEVRSSLPLALLATMESEDPEYSIATILDTESMALAPYSPKDQVRPGVTVHEVGRGRVVLRNGAQLEYIEMGDEVPKPRTTKPTTKPEPSKNSSRSIPGAEEAIKCATEDNCVVERGFVEQILNNPASLAKQARVVPAVRDGETKGFKFYGIRPGSLPRLLGVKNGDMITSVNGHDLKSLDGAMALYTKLRRASHLSVTLERKGKTIQKEIDIQ